MWNLRALIFAIVVVCLIVLIIYFKSEHFKFSSRFVTKIKSSLDNEYYTVSKKYDDKEAAADTMSILTSRIHKILKILKKKYLGSLTNNDYNIKPTDSWRVRFVKTLLKNYRLEIVKEINPDNTDGDTSYVINKGEQFVLCLRNKINKKLHDIDILTFVALHELTHMGTIDYHRDLTISNDRNQSYIINYDGESDHIHGELFWINFKFLLREAYENNILKRENYNIPKNNQWYCGLLINYNPYFDSNIFNI